MVSKYPWSVPSSPLVPCIIGNAKSTSVTILLNNPFLANKGPKLNVSYSVTNDISANLKNKITPYGINNAIIETSIDINLILKIVIPMSSKKVKTNLSIPISIKIIEGEVPSYYLNGYNENSKLITLPIN